MAKATYAQRIFAIMNLLRDQTDESHRMDAKEIARELERQKGLEIDPRSVRRAINEMIEGGCPIDHTHKYYYRGQFTSGELEYLQKAVRYGAGLTQAQRVELNHKLARVDGYDAQLDEVYLCQRSGNPNMLDTLALLKTAMHDGRKVAFGYGYYDVDGTLKPISEGGKEKTYNASPQAVVMANGRYYLLATVNRHTELSHYRIDRIIGIRQLRAKLRPFREPLDAEKYINEHAFMYTGPTMLFRVRVKRKKLNDVFDWFGDNVEFENITDTSADALVYSDRTSMDFWLHRYYKTAKLIDESPKKTPQ